MAETESGKSHHLVRPTSSRPLPNANINSVDAGISETTRRAGPERTVWKPSSSMTAIGPSPDAPGRQARTTRTHHHQRNETKGPPPRVWRETTRRGGLLASGI